ncbi:MAG: hypothetical protein FWF92_05500 [Oscillospiraceae bacterium]|nr:hypothetical protein [Oscillospiraceae bacterium]
MDKIDNIKTNAEEQVNINSAKRGIPRITQTEKKGLSEFTVNMQGVGGEVSCVWTDKTQKFSDISELFKFIEEQCDIVWYPQSQRKLRGWDD